MSKSLFPACIFFLNSKIVYLTYTQLPEQKVLFGIWRTIHIDIKLHSWLCLPNLLFLQSSPSQMAILFFYLFRPKTLAIFLLHHNIKVISKFYWLHLKIHTESVCSWPLLTTSMYHPGPSHHHHLPGWLQWPPPWSIIFHSCLFFD